MPLGANTTPHMVHVPSWFDTRFAPAPGGTDGFRQPGPCSRELAAPWWKVMEASKVLEFRRLDPALWVELAYSLCGEGEGGRKEVFLSLVLKAGRGGVGQYQGSIRRHRKAVFSLLTVWLLEMLINCFVCVCQLVSVNTQLTNTCTGPPCPPRCF